MCGYLPIRKTDNSIGIGYWLNPDYHGRGIVTQSVKYLINYAFETLALNSVRIAHALGNEQSRRVILNCGFVYEGIERQGDLNSGHYIDVARYSLLASDPKRI